MAKRRRLEDLYVRGRELSVDDGSGDPVTVWLQKMNPLEHEKAIRKAGAAKAQVLLAQRDHQSEEWQEALTDVSELGGRDVLIEQVIQEEVAKLRESKEAELSFEDEWKKEGYLEGLREAWQSGLDMKYAEDPEDPEARRVFLELKRFTDQLDEQLADEIDALRRDYDDMPLEQLQDKVVDRVLDMRAGLAWLKEYRRCEVFFSVRDPDDHDKYYFSSRDEVDRLSAEVFRILANAYEELAVPPLEGKDSGKTPDSLPSSEQPAPVVETVSSGLQVVSP